MSARVVSLGLSPIAVAALLVLSFTEIAAAARCPLGEIYRPSRGICVSKEKAIAAGVYRGAPARETIAARAVAPAPEPAIEPEVRAAAPKPRPQALAQIERQAPAGATRREDEALAFAPPVPVRVAAKAVEPALSRVSAPVEPRPILRASARPRETTPFGALVALEPMP